MSNVYALEPRTNGRLLLRTSHGPVEISLFSSEAPRAARSLVTHAYSGYYDNLLFHRVIPDVLAQVGDPTRTGDGGRAATEAGVVPRETHGRLKFRRRGLVALVSDDAGRCRSQFFITLGKTEWLDNQHTIVGTVEGDTIFNVLQMAENGEVDGFEVPGGPKLLSIDVVENPFEDIVPVEKVAPTVSPASAGKTGGAKQAIKNKTLLSFGNEDDEDDDSGSDSVNQVEANELTQSNASAAEPTKKRPRTGGGILSRYDLVTTGSDSGKHGRGESGRTRFNSQPASDSGPPCTKISDCANRGKSHETDWAASGEQGGSDQILSAAEQEFARLQADFVASAAGEKRDARGDEAEANGEKIVGNGEEEGGNGVRPTFSLPKKYSSLQRGVVRTRGSRWGIGAGGAERMELLRARVAASAADAKPLVFHAVADSAAEDDYEVFDPLLGKRGRNNVAPPNVRHSRGPGQGSGRARDGYLGRGRGVRRYG